MTSCLPERLMLVMSYQIELLLVLTRIPLGLITKLSLLLGEILVYRKWVLRGRNSCTKDNVRKVQNDTNRLIKKANKITLTTLVPN